MVAPGVHPRTVSVPQYPILNSAACSRSTAHTPPTSPHPSRTHSHSESTGTTHRSCCQSSAQRIIPAVLLAAVTVVKDMDELETSPKLLIQAYSPPPPRPDIPIVQHITPHLHTPREHTRLTQHDYLDP